MQVFSIVSGVCLSLFGADEKSTVATNESLPKIGLSKDGRSFVLAGTEKEYRPWGFNYLGRHNHLAEDDWHTVEGWDRIVQDFREMKTLGANVVRWHLQFETFMDAPDRVKPDQIDRLKKLLELSREAGLYLDLTGLNCFRRERIPAWYDKLEEADRWSAQAHFWEAVAQACSGHPAVFCYDLTNEPVIGAPRDADEHPWVTGKLGEFYFLQRIANKPDGRDSKQIAEAWVKKMHAAIRKHDRSTLLTVGVIPWAFAWENAKPIFYTDGTAKYLDFVSIHVYPKSKRIDRDIKAVATYDIGKPLVIEEFFPMACSLEELDQFMEGTSGTVNGWIAHYFGEMPAEHRKKNTLRDAIVASFLEHWQKKAPQFTSQNPQPKGK